MGQEVVNSKGGGEGKGGSMNICEVCYNLLEPDGSCLTCRLAEEVKRLKERVIDLEKEAWIMVDANNTIIKLENEVKRLREGIAEVLDGTLPYLAKKRLKELLEDK